MFSRYAYYCNKFVSAKHSSVCASFSTNACNNDSRGDKKMNEINDKERQPCEVWTRVMGYHRPVAAFNKGKKEEFNERQYFKESKAVKQEKDDELS